MDLIVTDATGKPVASHASYTLDLAFGSGENIPEHSSSGLH